MATSPVIHALKRKRAVISGELYKAEARCAAMRQHLAALDQTLKLMGYEGDPKDIRPVKTRQFLFRKGELPRAIMDIQRTANGPLTDDELTGRVMALKGLDADNGELVCMVLAKVKAARKRLAP